MFVRFFLCLLVLCVACEKKETSTAQAPAPTKVPAQASTQKDQIFTVHYNRTFKEAWQGAHVNSIADHATDEFFKKQESEYGNRTLAGRKFAFNSPMTCGAIADYMARLHYRPATLMEQLAYMETYPGEPFAGAFVVLGTIWEHDTVEKTITIHLRDYVYIDNPNTERDLKLWRCNNPMGPSAISFGVKEVKQQ